MGLLGKLFGKSPKSKYAELLDSCVTHLRVGLFTRVYAQYKNEDKDNKPALIAGTIMNYISCEDPINEEGRLYLQNNKLFIEQEARKLIQKNPEIRYAIAMLYTASICLIPENTGNLSEHVDRLTSRATDIGVQMIEPDDLGGPFNTYSAIADFANKFRIETEKISPSVYSK